MTMKSLVMFYVVLLLVSLSVIHINHALEVAHEENGAIQERALIPRLNYTTVIHARKLLLLPDIGDGDDDGTGNFGDVGGGVGNGSVGGGVDNGGGGVGNGSVGDVGGGVGNGGGDGSVGDGNVGDGNGGDNGTGGGDGNGDGSENRMGPGLCSKNNIQVNQGATSPLPSGIPTYTVIIENACYSESCSISNIHLNCGWFSSARLINPKVFRRLDYDDCLVNDGQPLTAGQSLTFIYANSFPYKLSVSSIAC